MPATAVTRLGPVSWGCSIYSATADPTADNDTSNGHFLGDQIVNTTTDDVTLFDADGVALVNQFARQVTNAGGTTIIVTHDYARAHGAVDRVMRLEEGRVLAGLPREPEPLSV